MSYDSSISLDAQPKPVGGKEVSRKMRRAGLVPLTLYGGGVEAASGSVQRREFTAIVRSQGRNSIFNLNLGGTATPVKIADWQLHPVKGHLMHLDLMRISLTEKTEFEVNVETVGEADGVKQFNGILDQPTHTLKIRCLPTDVPQEIEIDVSGLGIGDHFRVSDLQIDREKIEVLADDDLVLATVVAARVEEEPVATGDEPVEPEVIKKGKPEDDA
ncbi:MAG: 50S ribosomal protein L25 [Acidobacteriota bacterium]